MHNGGRPRWVKATESVILSMVAVLALGLAGAVVYSLGQRSADMANPPVPTTIATPPAATPTPIRVPTSVPETDGARQIVPTKIGDLAIEGHSLIALTWLQCVTLLEQANYYDSQAAFISVVGVVPRPGSAHWNVQCDVRDELHSLTDALGPGRVLGEIEREGDRLVLFCRSASAAIEDEYFYGSLSVVHLARPSNGPEFISSIDEITVPAAAYSGLCGCRVEKAEIDGDEVLFGHCRDGGSDGASTAYAVALPSSRSSGVALDVRCGGTRFERDGEELVLISQAFKAGGGFDAFPYPEVRFRREHGRFIADDLDLLIHLGCELENSSQLVGVPVVHERALSFVIQDSAIGPIGIHDEVIVGLDPAQCQQLVDSWWQDGYVRRVEAVSPIADVTGLDPPAGFADWFPSCHVPVESE